MSTQPAARSPPPSTATTRHLSGVDMAFRFDGSGSLRIETDQDTDEIMIAGIAERHSSLSSTQVLAAFLSSSDSAYKTAGGALTDDGQYSGLRYADADAAISTVINWSS